MNGGEREKSDREALNRKGESNVGFERNRDTSLGAEYPGSLSWPL